MIRKTWVRTREQKKAKPTYRPGYLVVRWKADTMAPTTRGIRTASLPEHLSDPIRYLRENCGLKEVIDIGAKPSLSRGTRGIQSRSMAAASLMGSFDPATSFARGLTVLKIDPKKEGKALKALKGRNIMYAELAANRWIAGERTDPKFNLQWSLPAIRWTATVKPDAASINVAVLDTGVDRLHPDLKSSVTTYNHFTQSAEDLVGHGTHVAGIIGAVTNNKVGIAGVANCNLHCWKVFTDEGEGDEFDNPAYYRALGQIIDSSGKDKIKVVNLSLGGTQLDRTERGLIQQLIEKGVIVVAAMGNEYEDGNPVEYPAAINGVLAVGAVDEALTRAQFSNTGKHIQLVAPGVSILSTLPRRKSGSRTETMYASWDGTSMATPIVSGSAALTWARHPSFNANQVIEKVLTTTSRLNGMGTKKRTNQLGFGLVNLQEALK